MQFDLISDLHVDKWEEKHRINWEGLGTSLVCVIAGDVCSNLDIVYNTVTEIADHYKHVIYTDGNHEHANMTDINQRREYIGNKFKKHRNITYLYRNTIILDNTAFIGSNGWFSYDFGEPFCSKEECFHYELTELGKSQELLFEQWEMALEDSTFLSNAVEICSKDNTVDDIVVVTHTLPTPKLAWFPPDGKYATMGTQGNSNLEDVLRRDRNNKIKTWAFGHVHTPIDRVINGVRYVSNPRGIPSHQGSQTIYYPKMIKSLPRS